MPSPDSEPSDSGTSQVSSFTVFEPPESAPAEPCRCAHCPQGPKTHLPVYLFSGEFHHSVEDLRIKGRGLDFVWARKYRSRIGPNTPQGHGWDFSYNIRLERFGENLKLFDGNSRQDVYVRQPNGAFIKDGFFREILPNGDGSYHVLFPDGGTWHFHRFDGSAAAGKISRLADRNGNTLAFDYDSHGRLVSVVDTLGRRVRISFNAQGLIEAIVDFADRQVRYTYYQESDADGSLGDLRSVTSPAVVGTPHDNDFPDGKTTTYAYSKGFADERLNHRLLRITDAGGRTYLRVVYSTETNPAKLAFDRVSRLIWGNPNDIIDIVYLQETMPGTHGAAIKAIVNDRVGNVKEYVYDKNNRVLIHRVLTGRATPTEPTTATLNRPSRPLRATDPPFFETHYEWNKDSLPTRIVYPNGNSVENVYESALNPNAPWRSRGNLRIRQRRPSPSGADQDELVERFEYLPGRSGCCELDFITKAIDPRGGVTLQTYDERGNRTKFVGRIPTVVEEFKYNSQGQMTARIRPDNGSGHRRRDAYVYHVSGSQTGYLRQEIIDVTGLAMTTTYEYDQVGNISRMIDPRGHDSIYSYNQLDQVVRQTSREVVAGSGLRCQTDRFYDEDDNVIRIVERHTSDHGAPPANEAIAISYGYDILNRLVRVGEEAGPGHSVVTEYDYDGNGNRILIRKGEAANGHQPANVVRALYDERDALFSQIRAPGDTAQSTMEIDYDGNGNRSTVRTGLEGVTRVTSFKHDGYGRLVRSVDPMGSVSEQQYDANGNPTVRRTFGTLMDGVSSPAVRLSETLSVYDAMDRRVRSERAYFDTETQSGFPGGQSHGKSIAAVEYNDNSQITKRIDDNGHETRIWYDRANRPLRNIDAHGNSVDYAYDANSNVTSITEVERSVSGPPETTFVTTKVYDDLDRLVAIVDSVGNTTRYAYDYRDNRVSMVDALGNVVRYEYDGLDRLTRTTRFLTDTGTGTGTKVGAVVTTQAWDDSSRLIAQTDDNGNTTTYAYDPSDREIASKYADGTQHSCSYDAHDNCVTMRDSNGTVVRCAYDLNNRLTEKKALPGPGVSRDTTFERYRYDGLSRLVRAENDHSLILRKYDSLSLLAEETLNGQTIRYRFDGDGHRVVCKYAGGRTLSYVHDGLGRVTRVSDENGPAVTWQYRGASRIAQRVYANRTKTEFQYNGLSGVPNAADDRGVKKISRITHTTVNDQSIVNDHSYTWSPVYNKTRRRDLRPGGSGLTHDYQYDSTGRLRRTTVTDAAATVQRETHYQLDGVGNRTMVKGSPDPGVYTMNGNLTEPADRQVNQYTSTPFDRRGYDRNGNLTSLNSRTAVYDYRNQMVRFSNPEAGVDAVYVYDACGRRIRRVIRTSNAQQTTCYFYDGFGVCEEQDGNGHTEATYVLGRQPGVVLAMRRGSKDFYYHHDDLGTVMAITDVSGNVAERYEYQDFGVPSFFGPTGNAMPQSVIGNPYLFTGQPLDPESGLYYCRTRYLDPRAGRFTTRDIVGIWEDGGNRGNGYSYVGNNPQTLIDPLGEHSYDHEYNWECFGRTLEYEFDDCSTSREELIGGKACRAYRAFRQAYIDVRDLVLHDEDSSDRSWAEVGTPGPTPSDAATRARVALWFGGPDGGTSLKTKRKIRDVLRAARQGFRNYEIGFECEPASNATCSGDPPALAYVFTDWVSGLTGPSDVHLCPAFWSINQTPSSQTNEQASTIAHEMTHVFGGTEDLYPDADVGAVGADIHGGHGSRTLRRNAESYAAFLEQFYIPAPAAGSRED